MFKEEIFEKLNLNDDYDNNSFTGMFAPLNLLYFVKNEKIYFWDFSIDKIYPFEEIKSNILNIHFTIPKEGVFSADVIYYFIFR